MSVPSTHGADRSSLHDLIPAKAAVVGDDVATGVPRGVVRGLEGASLEVLRQGAAKGEAVLSARPDDDTIYRVFVTAPRDAMEGKAEAITTTLRDRATGAAAANETVFRGPK